MENTLELDIEGTLAALALAVEALARRQAEWGAVLTVKPTPYHSGDGVRTWHLADARGLPGTLQARALGDGTTLRLTLTLNRPAPPGAWEALIEKLRKALIRDKFTLLSGLTPRERILRAAPWQEAAPADRPLLELWWRGLTGNEIKAQLQEDGIVYGSGQAVTDALDKLRRRRYEGRTVTLPDGQRAPLVPTAEGLQELGLR